MIPAPAVVRTPDGPPLYDKAALATALGLTFELTHTEAQIAMRLVTQGCLSREQICVIATRAHQPIKLSSVNALISGLRRKLLTHGVVVRTINGFGFELRKGARNKIRELLATHGTLHA